MTTTVRQTPAASAECARIHFDGKLQFETDCADVHYALTEQEADFVLVDVRTPDRYAAGHVPGAINIPTRLLTERRLAGYTPDTLFVVYCSGTHCNGSTKAALRLARLGRPVKEMIGGIMGWIDEGFAVETGERLMAG
jgi:rhodanese-related sulfurtransferase